MYRFQLLNRLTPFRRPIPFSYSDGFSYVWGFVFLSCVLFAFLVVFSFKFYYKIDLLKDIKSTQTQSTLQMEAQLKEKLSPEYISIQPTDERAFGIPKNLIELAPPRNNPAPIGTISAWTF